MRAVPGAPGTTAGPLPSTGVTRLPRYYQPLRHPLAYQPTSRSPVIRPTLLRRFSRRGEEGFSSCFRASSSPCRRYHHAGVPQRLSASASLRCVMLPSSALRRFGLRGMNVSWPPVRSLSLRPGDSPATLSDDRVSELQFIGFPPPCHSSYGALALTPAGLSPAERASLC